jgi:hypothetical protein
MPTLVKDLFSGDIYRLIEEVIKVDQTDEQVIGNELAEYVVTNALRRYFIEILELYWETLNKPREGTSVWVSGFFGSGKSSFAKVLGLAIENRPVGGKSFAELFGRRAGDTRIEVLLRNIREHLPTEAVIFDVSTDRGIRSGNQTLTEIMYRLFLQRLGYAKDLDLAELEITLEAQEKLARFAETYRLLFKKEWDKQKNLFATSLGEASRVMHELDPQTYPQADSWAKGAMGHADITPGLLAERCKELMGRRRPGKTLLFVVDEVGQFVARDVQKMLDLMGIVQSLGRVGRGKIWCVVTSQEKLAELVGGIDDRRVELARLMDRFPLQVHLEPSDISEVTSRRVLSKNSKAAKVLRELFDANRGRLVDNARLTADIRLPELTAEGFVDLYPLLPYQVDMIINIVSGLRMQGGASKHVGGANRTIIKLAQQLLVNPASGLATQPVGHLARIDQIYKLIEGNIASELRGKITAIAAEVEHPLAQAVAQAVCLLQFVQSIHRTPENIAATLLPAVDADSRLVEVRAALEALERAHMVRRADDGYRIPSPVEDDWERQRGALSAKPGDAARLRAEAIQALWQPQPQHTLLETKKFKAGLTLDGRELVEGDMAFNVVLAMAGRDSDEQAAALRTRSHSDTRSVFWVAAIDETIERQTQELFRSREMLSRKTRGAQTRDETSLVAEERGRMAGHEAELKRLLKLAMLSGSVYFRGNDRGPDSSDTEVTKFASGVLAMSLPEVFDRFKEAAALVQKQDIEALLVAENLRHLTPLFVRLGLLKDHNGQPVLNTDVSPLSDVLARIENRTSYGETASGRYLADEFATEPFGWDFDMVKLLVLSLLRAGRIVATSGGQAIESALSLPAKTVFTNNTVFRQASFQLASLGDQVAFEELVRVAEAFQDTFGRALVELEQASVATAIRDELAQHEEDLHEMISLLNQHKLPGVERLESARSQMRAMASGKHKGTILAFSQSHTGLKEAIKRTADLTIRLTEPSLLDLARAQAALSSFWPFLQAETDLPDELLRVASQLSDLLCSEGFYRELPTIDQHAREIEQEYDRRYTVALAERATAYREALSALEGVHGWAALPAATCDAIAAPLTCRTTQEPASQVPIPELRADTAACATRLGKCIEEAMRAIDGERVVAVSTATYFAGGVDTEEQLEAALTALRDECLRLIGLGKKILIR